MYQHKPHERLEFGDTGPQRLIYKFIPLTNLNRFTRGRQQLNFTSQILSTFTTYLWYQLRCGPSMQNF